MAQRKPDGKEVKKLVDEMDEKELDEVFENPVVQEYLKKNGNGNGNGK